MGRVPMPVKRRPLRWFPHSLALLLAACVSPAAVEPEDLANMAPDEGLVAGAVLVTALGPREEAALPLFKSYAGDQDYRFVIGAPGQPAGGWFVDARLDREVPFLLKLKAGDYEVLRVLTASYLWEAPIGARFTVEPGKTTYIGTVTLEVPDPIRRFYRFPLGAADRQEQVVQALRARYPALDGPVQKKLVALSRQDTMWR